MDDLVLAAFIEDRRTAVWPGRTNNSQASGAFSGKRVFTCGCVDARNATDTITIAGELGRLER